MVFIMQALTDIRLHAYNRDFASWFDKKKIKKEQFWLRTCKRGAYSNSVYPREICPVSYNPEREITLADQWRWNTQLQFS